MYQMSSSHSLIDYNSINCDEIPCIHVPIFSITHKKNLHNQNYISSHKTPIGLGSPNLQDVKTDV